MRLLRTDTLELKEFIGRVPPYVILSHRWGTDEVSFQDLSGGDKSVAKRKEGYAKIAGCCARAQEDGYEWAWVDTCCIDKTSSAELSEAINSMYRWYQEAHICYAYMSDVTVSAPAVTATTNSNNNESTTASLSPPGPSSLNSSRSSSPKPPQPARSPSPLPKPKLGSPTPNDHRTTATATAAAASSSPKPSYRSIPSILREYEKLPRTFEHSKWFTRGWTLQELIAPPMVEFYSHDWREIGTKFSLRKAINRITGIDMRVLEGADPSTCHVAERLSWAANRETTRTEDAAYCLLGIFKVHMPLIYGEGQRAFFRLQEEIMKTTEDYTMLAWGLSKYLSSTHIWSGVQRNRADPRRPLAAEPRDFELHSRSMWTYSRLVKDGHSVPVVRMATSRGGSNISRADDDTPPLMTSRGLRVSLRIRNCPRQSQDVHAYINCKTSKPGDNSTRLFPVCLILRRHENRDANTSIYTGSNDPNAAFLLLDRDEDLAQFEWKTIYLSTIDAAAGDELHNHRITSLDKNLYMLDKPRHGPVGTGAAVINMKAWKITSCFSHALGAGPGHTHFESPRKFTLATLFHPFDLPPFTARVFAFEPPSMHATSAEAFAIVVGSGWCDVVGLAEPGVREAYGVLVRAGKWDEEKAMRFLCDVAKTPRITGHEDAVDRVVRRLGGLSVSVALKKIRSRDFGCESAIRIVWTVERCE